jgi:hypothetical protein
MPYFFRPFQRIPYDIGKSKEYAIVTNVLNRFKFIEALKKEKVIYFTHTIKEHERADHIADLYYQDPKLDWVIFVVNEIMDPQWEYPLEYDSFNNFLISKYGSVEASTQQIHHYEKIIQPKQILIDGTIVDEIKLIVDQTTYNSTLGTERRIVYAYDYEFDRNESYRFIKILHPSFIPDMLAETRSIFNG